jgi:hypothetical protein
MNDTVVRECDVHADPTSPSGGVTRLGNTLRDNDDGIEADSLGRTLLCRRHQIAAGSWLRLHQTHRRSNLLTQRVECGSSRLTPSGTTGLQPRDPVPAPTWRDRCGGRRSAPATAGLKVPGSDWFFSETGTVVQLSKRFGNVRFGFWSPAWGGSA